VLTQLVGNLPSSSFHLFQSLSLSHFASASLTQLYPFTTKSRLSSLLHTLRHAPSPPLPSLSLSSPSLTITRASRPPPSVFHRRFRKSKPLPSIYGIARVISSPHACAQLSLISLSGCILSPQIVPILHLESSWATTTTKESIRRVVFSDCTTSP